MSRWKNALVLGFIMLLLVPLVAAEQEMEPNNTLLDPQAISDEVTGSVTAGSDIDNFMVDVPGNSLLMFVFEKTDPNITALNMDMYDSFRQRISDHSLMVETPGESVRDHLSVPSGDGGHYFFTVWGNGSYLLKVRSVAEFQLQEEYYWSNWTDIGMEKVSGYVKTVKWEGMEFYDRDLYSVETTMFGDIRLTLTKTDTGAGTITMLVEYDWGDEAEVTVDLMDPNSSVTLSYPFDIVVTIEGEGNYTLEVDEPPIIDSDTALVLGGILCGFGAIVLFFIILLIVIILIVVRSNNKNEKK